MKPKMIRALALALTVLALTFLTVAIVSADDNIDPSKYDGRINVAEWVGGNAVYCVNAAWAPTSDGWSQGGIRVLDGGGQPVFFVGAAEIDAVGVPAVNTLIKSEGGFSLYRQPDGGFSLNGVDHWDKPFNFVFPNCVPIGPVPYTHESIPCVARPVAYYFLPGNVAERGFTLGTDVRGWNRYDVGYLPFDPCKHRDL